MTQTIPPKAEQYEVFRDLMRDYGAAFDTYDLERILNTYHTPCFIFKS